MLNQLAGYDKYDFTSVLHPKEDYVAALQQPISDLRIGIPRAPFYDYADKDTASALETAIAVLSKMTKSIHDVSLPSTAAYSWLGLHDIGYEVYAYHEELFKERQARYGLALRLQLQAMKDELNASGSSASAKVSDYIRHRWELETLRRVVDDAFTDFDLVVVPTLRITPTKLTYMIDREENPKPHSPEPVDLDNCTPFNIFGLPAISIPCGFSREGLPIGMMIAGPHFSEGKILALARAYELATKWDQRRPPLTPDTPVPAIRPS
jgi:aspartyl-tRNA(Asn)/glutamyl-tRNA(Gln) amidotransferase subunit A